MNLLLSLCSRLSRIDRSLLTLERGEVTQEGVTEERVRQARAVFLLHPSVTCLHWTHYLLSDLRGCNQM